MNDERRVEVHPGCEAVIDFDPELTFECVDSCTWCCQHGVLLSDHDLLELAERANLNHATTDFRGKRAIRRERKDRDEHTSADGAACYFLSDDGLCELHADYGWKPARCSVFPLEISLDDEDIHVSVREEAHDHCEGLDVSDRRVIDHLDSFLPEVLWSLRNPETEIKL
ncbi:MAG TPA: YkgJ family cysteine cluster protein [Halococcus sp.]|nr:YkgJ family cysteine cluster protein [Halococcus sp.]